jgi:hypothetical protein
MTTADVRLVARIRELTDGSVRILITLARRGKRLQQEQPERAEFLLGSLCSHPLYKGGRLAFDMLEIEDLILDATSVVPMSVDELMQALRTSPKHLLEILTTIASDDQRHRTQTGVGRVTARTIPDDSLPVDDVAGVEVLPRLTLGPGEMMNRDADRPFADNSKSDHREVYPEIQSSDYLYDCVVLGLLDVVARMAHSSLVLV